MHKQIKEAQNFDKEIERLIEWIRDEEYAVKVKGVRRYKTVDGDPRHYITKEYRKIVERKYRLSSKRDVQKAIYDENHIIKDIEMCPCWAWYW